MSRPAFLAAYEAWVRAGRPGFMPSPKPHGLTAADVTLELCAIDERVRLETGLSSWQFYAPRPRLTETASARLRPADGAGTEGKRSGDTTHEDISK